MLWRYASTPGPATESAPLWPDAAGLERVFGRWTLVMFLHPRCPCSRASLAELERLQTHLEGRCQIWVIHVCPAGTDAAWDSTPIVRRAAALPGARIVRDQASRLAELFGARTSGECFLYDPLGRLAFHGGITLARGHEGDNPGSQAIVAFVAGKRPTDSTPAIGPVFGCPLVNPKLTRAVLQETSR